MQTNRYLLAVVSILLFSIVSQAQTNVRAWYAKGQVWVVWEAEQPFPQTYTIYKNNVEFTHIAQATAIGRPFLYECFPGTFILQTGNPDFKYKIPKPDGSYYVLAENEALFVETPLASGSAYYAVLKIGATNVVGGVNRTLNAVPYQYNPVNDPVTCHLQYSTTLPTGHKTNWYGMWAMGKQDHWAGRPDFPVMANAFKNGMPAMFIVSEALGMDTTGGKRIPLTNWFHGGGGNASQMMANRFQQFNTAPGLGITAAHNDDFPHILIYEGDTTFSSARSLWFGWTKGHNPFNPGYNPGPNDTVINYTQRRILWINEWLVKNYRVDPNHIALQGYSMGSAGASALGKAYPNRFSTVCAFNNGFRAGSEPTSENIVGTIEENLPTNLRRENGEVVRVNEVFDMTTPSSPARDFPLFRTWAGKKDINVRMHWGPDLVAQYRAADSLGLGAQISWDEREHTYPELGMYWINGEAADQQTLRDNTAFQELYSNNQTYPAFFNHRLDPDNNDPGVGLPGINNGDGDNWGTWGGYHNWDLNTLTDTPDEWEATAWLTDEALFSHDNCPQQELTSDIAIRKPQAFLPQAGTPINWQVEDAATQEILQTGFTLPKARNLIVLEQVTVYREDIRKVRIRVTYGSGTHEEKGYPGAMLQPNPANTDTWLNFNAEQPLLAVLNVYNNLGVLVQTLQVDIQAGNNRLHIPLNQLPQGIYYVRLGMGNVWEGGDC
jgi:predicted esterase